MINYNSTMLYQSSSNELMQAQHYQSQISQKEFEIRLMDINNRFTPNSRLDNFYIAHPSQRYAPVASEIPGILIVLISSNKIFSISWNIQSLQR